VHGHSGGPSPAKAQDPPERTRPATCAGVSRYAGVREGTTTKKESAELKNQIGLRRLRLRRLKFVREQFFLPAAAQNIKRLVRFLRQPTEPLTVTA
jgi:hypothetical protein